MTEEEKGRHFSNYVCLGCHGSKLFLYIPGHNDTIWYKNLLCINDLNCFLSLSIFADIVTYVYFGKPVDGSVILQIILYLNMSGYTGRASCNVFMSL